MVSPPRFSRTGIHHVHRNGAKFGIPGGGTFDVSILELTDGVFEVRATCGDMRLGGDDWDSTIVEWLADQFQKQQ